MLYEYAVDPSLLSDIHNCRTIFDNFRPERGKLIADVPRKWQREAFQAVNGIPATQCRPVMRKTLKKNLERLLKDALCANRHMPYWDRSKQTWLEHVLASQGCHSYAAVISAYKTQQPVPTYALPELFLNAPDCWNASSQASVARNAKAIVDALMPLFRISREFTLIDMHLYPGSKRYRVVIAEILRRTTEFNFGRGANKITLHVSDHRRDMQSSLEQHHFNDMPAGLTLDCFAWPKSIEHDRFALTDLGGVQLGQGFDECLSPDGPNDVLMSLLTSIQRKRLIAKFSGEATYRAKVSR